MGQLYAHLAADPVKAAAESAGANIAAAMSAKPKARKNVVVDLAKRSRSKPGTTRQAG